MADHLDPQVASAAVTGGFGLGSAFIGAVAGFWGRGRKRSSQDQRCERVCASMVGMGETMLAVLHALGLNDPRLAPHITAMEARMAEARAYLNETGGAS